MLNLKGCILAVAVFFVINFSFAVPPSPPDEGMWLLSLVNKYNYETMRQLGCKLTPEEIYSEQAPSLKDAIVSFGDFCTGEFVSDKGLLFTNHHCGFDAIASHSTTENNLIENGFWAADYSKELTTPGLFVKLMVHMQDVTDSIVPKLETLSADDRQKKIQELSKAISARASEEGKYKADVKSFFYGNQYFLFVYQVFHDVRLVGTAPASIGRFGGDTDNWMWPRHTCDFSVFRVYADKNNNPTSAYSPDNVPYKPAYSLPVSMKGINEGDFQMVMGYPGSTNRYIPSFAIQHVIDKKNPTLIKIISTITGVMKQDMDADAALKISLASDYASLMNSQKLYESQLPGLEKMHLVDTKKAEETAFLTWAEKQSPEVSDTYTQVYEDLKLKYALLDKVEEPYYYSYFHVIFSPAGNFAMDVNKMEGIWSKDATADSKQQVMDEVKKSADEYFKAMTPGTQKKISQALLELYCAEQPGEKLPQPLKDILDNYKGNNTKEKLAAFVEVSYSASILTSKERFDAFMSKPSMKTLKKDALYNYYTGLYAVSTVYRQQYQAVNKDIAKDMRIYMKGMMEKDPNRHLYPDANSTFRLSYGTVQDFEPRDAVHYDWMTTMSGIMEKEDSTYEDYKVPQRLIDLYRAKDFGRYDFNGDVPVCFITTNDITGGNSGSPVLNAKGEMTGLAFDGNYEGTAGDYEVDPSLNRTICVDIRYVLFIMEKYAGADNLVKELKIVY